MLGYEADGKLVRLRSGTGSMICLAPQQNLRVSRGMLPQVAGAVHGARTCVARWRGEGDGVDSVRFARQRLGVSSCLARRRSLLVDGAWDGFDSATVTAPKAKPLFVVYMPYATAATTAFEPKPVKNGHG